MTVLPNESSFRGALYKVRHLVRGEADGAFRIAVFCSRMFMNNVSGFGRAGRAGRSASLHQWVRMALPALHCPAVETDADFAARQKEFCESRALRDPVSLKH